jgi:hypothetical protein
VSENDKYEIELSLRDSETEPQMPHGDYLAIGKQELRLIAHLLENYYRLTTKTKGILADIMKRFFAKPYEKKAFIYFTERKQLLDAQKQLQTRLFE